MKTDFATGLIAHGRGSLLPCAPKSIIAFALLGCFVAGAFTAATGTAGAAKSERADTFAVNRTNKGDRLTPSPKLTSNPASPFVTSMRRPPLGCDPAFSRTDPARAHIFGRCLS